MLFESPSLSPSLPLTPFRFLPGMDNINFLLPLFARFTSRPALSLPYLHAFPPFPHSSMHSRPFPFPPYATAFVLLTLSFLFRLFLSFSLHHIEQYPSQLSLPSLVTLHSLFRSHSSFFPSIFPLLRQTYVTLPSPLSCLPPNTNTCSPSH